MDQKQAHLSLSEVSVAHPASSYNAGYAPSPGDLGGNPQPYGPQPGYPAGYFHPTEPGYPPQQALPSSQQANQQTVVVNQPMNQSSTQNVNTVPNNMGLAIFTTLCCCWLLGLVAIMKAQESRRALESGDIATASTKSAEARRYSIWGIVGGCILIVIIIIVSVVMVKQNSTHYTYSY